MIARLAAAVLALAAGGCAGEAIASSDEQSGPPSAPARSVSERLSTPLAPGPLAPGPLAPGPLAPSPLAPSPLAPSPSGDVRSDRIAEDPRTIPIRELRSIDPLGRVLGVAGASSIVRLSFVPHGALGTHRAELAFATLAGALDLAIVVPTARRAIRADELGSLTASSEGLRRFVEEEVSILNDGTAMATVALLPFDHDRSVGPYGLEIAELRAMARADAPIPEADRARVASYVEMLALDYLSANVLRRGALLTADGGLLLADNEEAFPRVVEGGALDRVLDALRSCRWFPRELAASLEQLTRERIDGLFLPGVYGDWLLSPRMALDLDERRLALLSLIRARVAERGPEAAFIRG